jgi:hypothetical protein
VFLALDRYPIDDRSQEANETANFVFFLIFVAEMLLKLFGFGLMTYVRDPYNLFDAFIVLAGTVELILQNL